MPTVNASNTPPPVSSKSFVRVRNGSMARGFSPNARIAARSVKQTSPDALASTKFIQTEPTLWPKNQNDRYIFARGVRV